jgi:hypothetical protein
MNSSGSWIWKALPSGNQEMTELSFASVSALSRISYNFDGNGRLQYEAFFLPRVLSTIPFVSLS